MSNEITKTEQNKKIGFTSYITSTGITQKINSIIGDEKKGARFISSIVSAVNANPALKDCDQFSFDMLTVIVFPYWLYAFGSLKSILKNLFSP